MAGTESEDEPSTPALFPGWELFLFSPGAVSVGEKRDEKDKQAEHKEYVRPCSTGYV